MAQLLLSQRFCSAHPRTTPALQPRRVRTRVAFTRVEALDEPAAAVQRASPVVLVREPSPLPQTVPVDTEQLQQLLLEEYKRGYEAGMAASSREGTASPPAEKELVHDSVQRTALKSLTWRVLSTATTITLALVMFNDSIAADAAMELGAVEFLSKYGLYFIHERAWAAITFLL